MVQDTHVVSAVELNALRGIMNAAEILNAGKSMLPWARLRPISPLIGKIQSNPPSRYLTTP